MAAAQIAYYSPLPHECSRNCSRNSIKFNWFNCWRSCPQPSRHCGLYLPCDVHPQTALERKVFFINSTPGRSVLLPLDGTPITVVIQQSSSCCCLQIVLQLLKALQSLLDRLAALQLAHNPPSVTGVVTGRQTLWFGVPVKDKCIHMFELHGLLASAVAAAVQHPESRTHCNAVKVLVSQRDATKAHMHRQQVS